MRRKWRRSKSGSFIPHEYGKARCSDVPGFFMALARYPEIRQQGLAHGLELLLRLA